MSRIWRFYSDADSSWHWQLLAFDNTVLEASACGWPDYERCVGNAEQHGYRYSPAKSTRPPPAKKLKFARRYASVHALTPDEEAASGATEAAPRAEPLPER